MIRVPYTERRKSDMKKKLNERENMLATIRHQHPAWLGCQVNMIFPREILDNVARGFVADTLPFNPAEDAGGKDMFGVTWVYEPSARGSMVIPGNPVLEDICDLNHKIIFPDLEQINWTAIEERCLPLIHPNEINATMVFTGLFERLISFLDFENAAIAMIDEEQAEYVHELFDRLAGYYDILFGKLRQYCHLDMITFHDDWGHQRSPFFSEETCRHMLLPYLSKIVESCHKNGMLFDFHCCGKVETLIPLMIDAGVDKWDGQMINDIWTIVEKYGDRICITHNEKLPHATAAEASHWAKQVLSRLHPNSGKNIFIPARALCPTALSILQKKSMEFYS